MICCYQVTKICSSRYGFAIASSAWGPCNFGPFTDLAISVFREMSMNIMFTQILTSLECRLQRSFVRRTGVREPPCNGISSSTKISLNSCSHSGISEFNELPRSIVVSFLFGFGFLLAWVSSGCHDPSPTELDTCTEVMSLSIRPSRSRV